MIDIFYDAKCQFYRFFIGAVALSLYICSQLRIFDDNIVNYNNKQKINGFMKTLKGTKTEKNLLEAFAERVAGTQQVFVFCIQGKERRLYADSRPV